MYKFLVLVYLHVIKTSIQKFKMKAFEYTVAPPPHSYDTTPSAMKKYAYKRDRIS